MNNPPIPSRNTWSFRTTKCPAHRVNRGTSISQSRNTSILIKMAVQFSMNSRILLLFLCTCVSMAQQLPSAPRIHLTDVTSKPGYFNEPSIAVNPKNPQQVVVAWQINASAAYSRDGGQTWTVAQGTAPREYRVSGDVSIAFDAAGHAILCYIAFDKLGTSQYWAQGATRNGIFLRRSLDGGKTWEPDVAAVISHSTTPVIPFQHKPYIVADLGSHAHKVNMYVRWTEF